jgi:hypothetical protein
MVSLRTVEGGRGVERGDGFDVAAWPGRLPRLPPSLSRDGDSISAGGHPDRRSELEPDGFAHCVRLNAQGRIGSQAGIG